MLGVILEAAFRSLLMALAVWGCVRLLRVRAVLAQKVTWVLVLAAAAAMPFVMRSPFLSTNRAVQIPLRGLLGRQGDAATVAPVAAPVAATKMVVHAAMPKPKAGHKADGADMLILSGAVAAAPAREDRVARALDSVTASPNPPAQLVRTFWDRAVSDWSLDRLGALAIGLYCVGCGLLLLRTVVGLGMAGRLLLRSRPVVGVEVADGLKVRVSRDLNSPVTIGSTVLLPADYAEWDVAKLRIVLAHERSHVRQGDFYLQLVAAIHAAIFWFSPLGWWLQGTLSELGEALSDRAGLEQAQDPAAYAQVLLEFAAMPRKHSIFQPVMGVAMARSSSFSTLSSRIERVLNANSFRLAFLGGRRHALMAFVLVPAVLVAVVAGIRVVPAVEAARMASVAPVAPKPVRVLVAQAAPAAPAAPAPPAADALPPEAPVAPEKPEGVEALVAPEAPAPFHVDSDWNDDGESFAIVNGDKNTTIHMNGNARALAKVRGKYHGNYIWFERDGKSYVITDPAVVEQAQAMFKMDGRLVIRQEQLQKMQAELDKKMAALQPEMDAAAKPGPEFEAQMKKLNAELAKLQTEDFKKLTAEISKEATQEKLAELQEKMGDIQGRIGELQGQIGERQGLVGEKQGELGEQMGKLGEEMGKIGEEEGRKAEEASRKMKSVLDQAVKDGKAQPVE